MATQDPNFESGQPPAHHAPLPAASKGPNVLLIVGIVLGGVLSCSLVGGLIAWWGMAELAEAKLKLQTGQNFKQIAMAMLNYQGEYQRLPPPYSVHPKTGAKTSWRVLLLPYLGHKDLYEQYDQSQSWDHPANEAVVSKVMPIYSLPYLPTDPQSKSCSVFVLTGEETVFPPDSPGTGIGAIADGTTNTLMLVEGQRTSHWAEPVDVPYRADGPLPELSGAFDGVLCVAFCDASVFFAKLPVDETEFRSVATRRGREVVWRDALTAN